MHPNKHLNNLKTDLCQLEKLPKLAFFSLCYFSLSDSVMCINNEVKCGMSSSLPADQDFYVFIQSPLGQIKLKLKANIS